MVGSQGQRGDDDEKMGVHVFHDVRGVHLHPGCEARRNAALRLSVTLRCASTKHCVVPQRSAASWHDGMLHRAST
ncbi:hypothetical protein Holit_00044 [Hollandina sp. SP2]